MAIDGKIIYRSMPPDKSTSWSKLKAGLHKFQIGTAKNPGSAFELDIAQDQKAVIVSVSDTNGDIQSRTVFMDKSEGECFVLNALHGSIISLPETDNKSIFGKGFKIPLSQEKSTITFTDSEGLNGALNLTTIADTPKTSFLAILSGNEDNQPKISLMRYDDALFEIGSENVVIPDELTAELKIITPRTTPKQGAFDPVLINWEEVESQIFWLNLTIGRDPCRLEIGGFPAMRRMPSGRGSGFVKWPSGNWNTDLVVELTNQKVGTSSFSLASKSSLGLISSGGGKFPHRLITLEGRSREASNQPAKPRIRFMNALPDGVLRCVVDGEPDPLTLTMEPGKATDAVPLLEGGFPGAAIDITLGTIKNQTVLKVPRLPRLPSGDWVLIIHLDDQSFSKPVQTWVEMDKGAIRSPSDVRGDE